VSDGEQTWCKKRQDVSDFASAGLKAKDARKHQQTDELWDFVMCMFDGARNQQPMDLVLLAPNRVGAVAVVAHLLRLSSRCSIPNMGV